MTPYLLFNLVIIIPNIMWFKINLIFRNLLLGTHYKVKEIVEIIKNYKFWNKKPFVI